MSWPSLARPLNPLAEAQPIIEQLEAKFPGLVTARIDGTCPAGDGTSQILHRRYPAVDGSYVAVDVAVAGLVEVCQYLRSAPELQFDLLIAETAVDWIDWFDLVYVLRSTALRHDLVFTVQVDHDSPVAPSVFSVWGAANWMEREVHDLMGIQFTGHPDLRRVLTWDEFEGHPLRKDFGLGEDARAFDQVPPGYKKVGEE